MGTRIEDIILFAIEEEIKAAGLYEKYAKIVKDSGAQRMLEEMALMERGHEQKLRIFEESGKDTLAKIGEVPDLQISDFLVEKELTEDSSVQDVFIFAMKAEQKAFELYTRLAELEVSTDTVRLFRELAEEERKHKLDLESEYEKEYMRDM